MDDVTRRDARVRSYLCAVAGFAGLLAVWVTLNTSAERGPAALGWALCLLCVVAAAPLCELAARSSAVAATRRFWRHIALAVGLVATGLALQANATLQHRELPATHVASLASLVVDAIAVLVILWALLRLPVGGRSRGDWLRIGLDAATVMTAAGLFSWYFVLTNIPHRQIGATQMWFGLGIAVVALVVLSACIKVLLVGAGPIHRGALRTLSCALVVGGSCGGLTSVLGDQPRLSTSLIATPVCALLTLAAAERQRRAGDNPPARSAARRPYSLLPYVAVAATAALLLFVTIQSGDATAITVAAVMAVVVGLVAVRQLTALSDNARLLARLEGQERRLRHQALHDALTGLANRTLFQERMQAACDAAGAHRLAVLLIDLDDFKSINDSLGHGVGDAVLEVAAARLRQCTRDSDTVARLGGDEFAVLLEGIQAGEAAEIAERILAALAQPVVLDGHRLETHASIGVVEVDGDGRAPAELLRCADVAMYAAKARGKAGYAHYERGMSIQLSR
jgi:diguanylate cyclase (GGDEF)-like protein